MQPRWLVNQMEELDYQTDFQVELVSDLLLQSQAINRLTQDYLGFAKSDVLAVHELYESLEKVYQNALNHAQVRGQRVETQVTAASTSEEQSTASLEDAYSLKSTWQHQAHLAEDWRSNAQSSLERCIAITKVAEDADSSAQSRLSVAESRLAAARARPPRQVYVGKDSQGNAQYEYHPPDTSSEEAAVRAASAVAHRCRRELNQAIHAQNLAQSELNRALNQLKGARNALSDARDSVELASEVMSLATDGKRRAHRSQESAHSCLEKLDQVRSLLDKFKQTCHQQAQIVAVQDSESNHAMIQMRNLEHHQESMQGEAFSLKYTLQDKANLLIAFDQPFGRR